MTEAEMNNQERRMKKKKVEDSFPWGKSPKYLRAIKEVVDLRESVREEKKQEIVERGVSSSSVRSCK